MAHPGRSWCPSGGVHAGGHRQAGGVAPVPRVGCPPGGMRGAALPRARGGLGGARYPPRRSGGVSLMPFPAR
eukprot:7856073-Alexandrium_andersonii.AAC.1